MSKKSEDPIEEPVAETPIEEPVTPSEPEEPVDPPVVLDQTIPLAGPDPIQTRLDASANDEEFEQFNPDTGLMETFNVETGRFEAPASQEPEPVVEPVVPVAAEITDEQFQEGLAARGLVAAPAPAGEPAPAVAEQSATPEMFAEPVEAEAPTFSYSENPRQIAEREASAAGHDGNWILDRMNQIVLERAKAELRAEYRSDMDRRFAPVETPAVVTSAEQMYVSEGYAPDIAKGAAAYMPEALQLIRGIKFEGATPQEIAANRKSALDTIALGQFMKAQGKTIGQQAPAPVAEPEPAATTTTRVAAPARTPQPRAEPATSAVSGGSSIKLNQAQMDYINWSVRHERGGVPMTQSEIQKGIDEGWLNL